MQDQKRCEKIHYSLAWELVSVRDVIVLDNALARLRITDSGRRVWVVAHRRVVTCCIIGLRESVCHATILALDALGKEFVTCRDIS